MPGKFSPRSLCYGHACFPFLCRTVSFGLIFFVFAACACALEKVKGLHCCKLPCMKLSFSLTPLQHGRRSKRMDKLRRSFRDSFRKRRDLRSGVRIPEACKPHQWQEDEASVRAVTCNFPVKVKYWRKSYSCDLSFDQIIVVSNQLDLNTHFLFFAVPGMHPSIRIPGDGRLWRSFETIEGKLFVNFSGQCSCLFRLLVFCRTDVGNLSKACCTCQAMDSESLMTKRTVWL